MITAESRSRVPTNRSTETAPADRHRDRRRRGDAAWSALGACACIVIVTMSLSGCALYDTYQKCGFRGCRADSKITADVVSQLVRCSSLEPNVIDVQTLDHVVYLYGVVASGLEIDTAESIAQATPGVARVVNSIVVSNAR